VEVVSTRAGLRIRVECDKRAGLLADIMKVLEARGLNVEEVSVAFEERFVLDCVGSLVQTQILQSPDRPVAAPYVVVTVRAVVGISVRTLVLQACGTERSQQRLGVSF